MTPLRETCLVCGLAALVVACSAQGPAADAGARDLAPSDLASSDGSPLDMPLIDAGGDASAALVESLTRATNLACADPSLDRDDALYSPAPMRQRGRSARRPTIPSSVARACAGPSAARASWARAEPRSRQTVRSCSTRG